jgi:hypothetical protein
MSSSSTPRPAITCGPSGSTSLADLFDMQDEIVARLAQSDRLETMPPTSG